ncbi:uncharacterized protein LOC126840395 [Adelges cooleyi]|uniref:uncharacterized protein LOC126840395 n=1 Tax=Adelges cooleyi TaxID=133065 RepID=UPI00217F9DEF|nr:uncharacterized protein LOC126840395 [Adelges cooleyi]
MHYKTVMFICLITMLLAFANSKSILTSLLQPIRHEHRFSYVEVNINRSFGEAKISYNQYNDVQYTNYHYIINDSLYLGRVNIEIIMCKEYFIDCSNLRTFDLMNICENLPAINYFLSIGYQNREITSCPLHHLLNQRISLHYFSLYGMNIVLAT